MAPEVWAFVDAMADGNASAFIEQAMLDKMAAARAA